MARAGTNLRTSYLESNEVLRRPYQKLLVGLILATIDLATLVGWAQALTQPVHESHPQVTPVGVGHR